MSFPPNGEPDSVTVTHYNGSVLDFKTQEECYTHVSENIPALKVLAGHHFPGKAVSRIDCFIKAKSV